MYANPYVWNYGDVTAENITTGDKFTLHMKNVGIVRGKNYKTKGTVSDADGNVR